MSVLEHLRVPTRPMVALVLLALLGSVAELLLPTLLVSMVDTGVIGGASSVIGVAGVAMAIVVCVGTVAGVAGSGVAARVSADLASQLRDKVFCKVVRLGASEMTSFGTHDLARRTTSDVDVVQEFLFDVLRVGVLVPAVLVAGLVLLAVTGGSVVAMLFVLAPAAALVGVFLTRQFVRSSRPRTKHAESVRQALQESFAGMHTIRVLNRQQFERERFSRNNEAYAQHAVEQRRWAALLVPATSFVLFLAALGAVGLGVLLVALGIMSVGALVACVQYVAVILLCVLLLPPVIDAYPAFETSAGRICEVLDASVQVVDGRGVREEGTQTGVLEFRRASLAYGHSRVAAVRDLTFVARPGTVTAIVGTTGSGKSSVLRLALRRYDATMGSVQLGGVNVREYTLDELRGRMSYAPQRNVLFTGDVASNISWTMAVDDKDARMAALGLAEAQSFVDELQDGEHTQVVHGGEGLSKSQRAQLVLARTLARPADVYLFDETFDAMDTRVARAVRNNIRRERGTATVILTTTQVANALDADQVIVLDEGRIQDMGTHARLLRSCLLYRELACLQLGDEVVAETLGEPLREEREAAQARLREEARRPNGMIREPARRPRPARHELAPGSITVRPVNAFDQPEAPPAASEYVPASGRTSSASIEETEE